MKKQNAFLTNLDILRQKAEKLLKSRSGETGQILSVAEELRIFHELQVSQIELELQNKELQISKDNLELSAQKYSDLYDFAPSGYFLLNQNGAILEINHCGSQMLRKDRSMLINRSFGSFVSEDTKQVFNLFLQNIYNKKTKETCELTLLHDGENPSYLQLTGNLAVNGEYCFINAFDISELRQIKEKLKESEANNRAVILHTNMDGFYITDSTGHLLEVNSIYCQMSGYTEHDLLSMDLSDLEAIETADEISSRIEKIIRQGHDRFETQHRRKDGVVFDVEISTHYQPDEGGRFIAFLHDITGRKMDERYRELSRKILQILNEPGNISDLLHRVLLEFKTGTMVDAVGIRLEEGDDFPYVCQEGFSTDFLLNENTLIDFSRDGEVCRDNDGKVCLACTCGLVISGKNDPSNPYFTPGGSFWTNDSAQIPDNPPSEEARLHPRNQCILQGYASMALIPIRSRDRIVGLLQLNDRLNDRFTSVTIEKLEGIASHIGAAIMRKHAEEKINASEKRRIAILETAMDGFWLLDMQGRLLEINETYCRMSGYSARELKSMHISDLEALKTEDNITTHLQKVIVLGEERFESRHRRKDGSSFDVEISCQYQHDEGGQFVTFIHDISERKGKEIELRQSEERYKSLFQSNYSVMLIIDPETGKIQDANPAACKYYGWTHSELCRKSISDINELPMEEIEKNMQNSKENKNNHLFFQHRLANGELRDVEIYSGPIQFGESVLLYSIIHDITDSKLAQEALIESELKFRKYVDHAPHGIFVVNEKGDYIDVNPAAGKITGYSKEELLSKKILDLTPEESLESAGNFFNRVATEGYSYGELAYLRKDRSKGFWSVDAVKLSENSFLGFTVDITRRKQDEDALKQLNEELEERVKKRTAELFKSNLALRQTELKYRTVADFTHDWEYWISPENTYNYISSSCERITGHKAEEFIQNPGLIYNIVHPDDLKSYLEHMQNKIWSQCDIEENQFRIIRSDGSVRWIGNVRQTVYDESGNFIGVRGSNRDITERKKIEQLLKTNNRKYRLLSANISDGIFICRDGCFEYVNRSMNHIFGHDEKEMIGMQLTQLISPEHVAELNFVFNLNNPFDEVKNVEIECLKKDQSTIFVEFLFNYVVAEGVIYGVVHDITEKKLLQKNIVKAIILTEEKEKFNFSKELHDGIGPLLSTIKLYVQWAEETKARQAREEILQKAEEVIEDALEAVKEISNRLSPHLLINFGLASAIQNFLDKLRKSSPMQITFDNHLNRRLDSEIEAAIYRATIECVNNTIKYSNAKRLTISLFDTGNQLQLHYMDDGIGFDLEETLSMKIGLGLFNLQNRIQNIGGKTILFSKPGMGVDYRINVNIQMIMPDFQYNQ